MTNPTSHPNETVEAVQELASRQVQVSRWRVRFVSAGLGAATMAFPAFYLGLSSGTLLAIGCGLAIIAALLIYSAGGRATDRNKLKLSADKLGRLALTNSERVVVMDALRKLLEAREGEALSDADVTLDASLTRALDRLEKSVPPELPTEDALGQ